MCSTFCKSCWQLSFFPLMDHVTCLTNFHFFDCSWIDAAKFLTGASSVGSIAIPIILRHADLIGNGAMWIEFFSFLVFVFTVMCFHHANLEDEWWKSILQWRSIRTNVLVGCLSKSWAAYMEKEKKRRTLPLYNSRICLNPQETGQMNSCITPLYSFGPMKEKSVYIMKFYYITMLYLLFDYWKFLLFSIDDLQTYYFSFSSDFFIDKKNPFCKSKIYSNKI